MTLALTKSLSAALFFLLLKTDSLEVLLYSQ